MAQKIRSIVRTNFKQPGNVQDELARSNDTDVSTDVSPLAEYFIKNNNQIQEKSENITNLLVENNDNDDDDDDNDYDITNVSSYNDTVRCLGKINSIINEMVGLKLPKLMKFF